MHKTITIQSSHELVHKLCSDILAHVRHNNFSQEDIFGIHLALEEALINAVKHGNKLDPHKRVSVKYNIIADKFEISITDEGDGFKPEEVPDPRCGQNLYKITGRGLLLMRSYMDSVEYNKIGNCVRMTKYRSKLKSKK
jgi:serine/threonine-protein kinase RsbW